MCEWLSHDHGSFVFWFLSSMLSLTHQAYPHKKKKKSVPEISGLEVTPTFIMQAVYWLHKRLFLSHFSTLFYL